MRTLTKFIVRWLSKALLASKWLMEKSSRVCLLAGCCRCKDVLYIFISESVVYYIAVYHCIQFYKYICKFGIGFASIKHTHYSHSRFRIYVNFIYNSTYTTTCNINANSKSIEMLLKVYESIHTLTHWWIGNISYIGEQHATLINIVSILEDFVVVVVAVVIVIVIGEASTRNTYTILNKW